ncbi:hypothetical protein [Pluralibacter gergoviae]|uniref:Uncharacterized protein n=1 Tax=Pluralibacter gergoviae TaxID=61647 RepID=A0AAW8HJB8_PLUGE|nr:hypothetical protein [Pluralibacter gergoviae]AVR02040.1 hypothetical protein A8H26_04625 [Pluralibacter gergoviae]KMK04248.1 hypothetical protein ABW08_11645 [Pluralibacter gergoviae]KMK27954.1 hypothetical protein ABW11_11650 [Pluralibacter gergoviae]MDQ2308532.1 hypothetical protein [Pluralibacter gergoviae]SUB68888.1 Uncharacterised protein [Pluralibacter gergoviae]
MKKIVGNRNKNSDVLILKGMLNNLKDDLNNFELLIKLQFKILVCVMKCEQEIKIIKKYNAHLKSMLKNSRLPKEKSLAVKEKIKYNFEVISDEKFKIYTYKMFGDAVAFLYIDKYTIKQLYYNVHNYNVKETSGNLSGKSGLREEWECVKLACDNKVPALLHDITMSIRYGDVSLLGKGEPFIIEMKSSSNTNKRVERQKSNLEKLRNFIAKDEAENFRGIPLLIRKNLLTEEVSYSQILNECLNDCRSKGRALAEAEKGFYICAVREWNMLSFLEDIDFDGKKEIFPVFLNQYKNNGEWLPLTPFTLLINDPYDLHDFIEGELTIACFLMLDEYKEFAIELGYELVFVSNDEYSIILKKIGEDIIFGVSWQMLLRVPLEMMSMSWLIKESINVYSTSLENSTHNDEFNQEQKNTKNSLFEKYKDLFSY